MISIEMDITAMALCQAVPTDASPAAAAEAPVGFAEALETAQTGAPPGPEPPPTGATVGEEGAILGQMALTQNPDFSPLPTDSSTQADPSGADDGAPIAGQKADEMVAVMAGMANGMFATPTVFANVKAGSGSAASPAVTSVTVDAMTQDADMRQSAIQDSLDAAVTATSDDSAGSKPFEVPPSPPGAIDSAGQKPKPQHLPPVDAPPTDLPGTKPRRMPPVEIPPADDVAGSKPRRMPPITSNADFRSKEGIDLPKWSNEKVVVVQEAPESAESAGQKQIGLDQTGLDSAAQAGAKPGKQVSLKASSKQTDINIDDAAEGSEARTVIVVDKVEDKSTDFGFDATKTATHDVSGVKTTDSARTAETAVIDTPKGIDRKDMAFVVKQITDRMELLAATKPRNGVTIQLQPAHLGSITMTIKSLGGSIEAQISASNDNVRQALEQNRSLLGASMEQRGIKLESVSIAPQSQSSTNTPRDGQQQAQQQQQQQQNASQRAYRDHSFAGPRSGLTSAHQARQTVRNTTGVDYWI